MSLTPIADTGKLQMLIQPRNRYDYLKPCQFVGVDRIPPAMGTRNNLWHYSWSGAHPKIPYCTHRFTLETNFERHFANATHQLTITVQRSGTAERRTLYSTQLDLSTHSDTEAVAEQLICAMVIFLLKMRDPGRTPGVVDICHSSQQSGWPIALRETMQGIIAGGSLSPSRL